MKLTDTAVTHWQKGMQARWVACYAAFKVTTGHVPNEYGTGRMNQRDFGSKLGVTRQYVSRLSNAWRLYGALRWLWLHDAEVREVYPHPYRVRITAHISHEHFTELWECHKRYDLSLLDVYEYLAWAWDGQVNAQAMRLFIDDYLDGKSQIPEWWTRAERVMSDLGKLKGDYGAPEEVKVLSSLTYDALKEWLEAGYEA